MYPSGLERIRKRRNRQKDGGGGRDVTPVMSPLLGQANEPRSCESAFFYRCQGAAIDSFLLKTVEPSEERVLEVQRTVGTLVKARCPLGTWKTPWFRGRSRECSLLERCYFSFSHGPNLTPLSNKRTRPPCNVSSGGFFFCTGCKMNHLSPLYV